jgi:hypothetical protein
MGIAVLAQSNVPRPENRSDKGSFVYGYFFVQIGLLSCEDKKNMVGKERFGKHFSIPIFTE